MVDHVRVLRERLRSDSGIGLTEVAVAIIVLGVVLVGLFPLAVDSIRLAVRNAEVAQANRIVSTQLDVARSALATATCTAHDAGAALTLPEPDASLTEAGKYVITQSATCDDVHLARVTVSVDRAVEPGKPVAEAATKVVTGG